MITMTMTVMTMITMTMMLMTIITMTIICRSGPDNERPVVRRVRMEGGSCQEVDGDDYDDCDDGDYCYGCDYFEDYGDYDDCDDGGDGEYYDDCVG